MKVFLSKRRFLPLITFFLGLLLASSIGYAIAQVANGTIYACVKTSNGSLRIVTSATTCNNGETALSWSQQGSSAPVFCPGCQIAGNYPSMVGKDFTNANLDLVQTSVVDFSQANFTNAFINGIGFFQDILDNTNFHNAISSGISLYQLTGNNTDFSGLHGPTSPTIISLSITDLTLTNCNFQNANVVMNFDFASLKNPTGSQPNLSGCNFSNANLSGIRPDNTHGSFANVNLSNANFTGANLTGVTDMNTANLTGVIWSNTTCPDGVVANDCSTHLTPAP